MVQVEMTVDDVQLESYSIEGLASRMRRQPKKGKPRKKVTKVRKGKVDREMTVCSSYGGSNVTDRGMGTKLWEKHWYLTDEEKNGNEVNLVQNKAFKCYCLERYGIIGKFNRVKNLH